MRVTVVLAVLVALSWPVTGKAQYQSYGVSFSNPVTAQMNTDVNSGIGSRLVYRMILKKHGYKDPELGQMKTEDMCNLIQSGNYAPRGEEGQKPTPQAIVQAAVPDKPASRFKPAGKRVLLPEMVKLLTDNKEYQDALLEVFETGIKEFEKEAAKHNMVNDVAGSIAFFIGCAYTVCKGGEEPDTEGLVLIARALQVQFNTEEFRKIPEVDKQKFYELMAALGVYLVATRQTAVEQKDEALAATIKKAATDTLKGYLKIDPAKFKITANGLEVASSVTGNENAAVARSESPPEPAGSLSLSDVSIPTPEGWRRADGNGLAILERSVDLGYGKSNVFRLIFASPRRVQGSSLAAFQSLWDEFTSATFDGPIRPLPLRVRLKEGGTLLYDGAEMKLKQNKALIQGFIYVVVRGGTALPIIGIYTGWDEHLDPALREVFDGVRFGGGVASAGRLFDIADIAGRWRASSTTLGNWVDASGNYRGDASTMTGETFTLNADGTFRRVVTVVGTGRIQRMDGTGRFTVEDDTLVLHANGEKEERFRITGLGRTVDNKARFLLLGVTRSDYPHLSSGSSTSRAGDAYLSVTD